MGHGWEGVVLKLMRGRDFEFTVTGGRLVLVQDDNELWSFLQNQV